MRHIYRAWDEQRQEYAKKFTLAETDGELEAFSDDAEMRVLELEKCVTDHSHAGVEHHLFEGDIVYIAGCGEAVLYYDEFECAHCFYCLLTKNILLFSEVRDKMMDKTGNKHTCKEGTADLY